MSTTPTDKHPPYATLRAEAEARLAQAGTPAAPARPPEELLYELQVHQIELELQNEELRRAYAALEESRDRFVDLYEFAPVGYFILTPEGQIAEINLAGAELLGQARKKLLQRRFSQFIGPDDRDRWDRIFLQALKNTKQSCELAFMRADGSRFYGHMDCHLCTANDNGPAVRIALSDVSERKEAELALQQADRHKAEFMAMMAHELRNPLAPIRNAAFVLGMLELDEPKLKWAQQLIESQVEHIAHMVGDLLDVSRITFHKIRLQKKTIEFSALIEQVMESVRLMAAEKRQQLAVHLPEQAVQLEVDPMRLSQVLLNLLENASKYTPDGGRIELEASVQEHSLKISVHDNGTGIPADLLPRVFDLFTQGECTLDRSQGGMGIGLSLVKHLVEQHDGRVEASSPGPGQGSTFTLWLPLKAAT